MLDVEDLHVTYATGEGPLHAVRGVSLRIPDGAVLGIVGESGSGKSTVIRAILGLLPSTATVSGTVRLDGQVLDLTDEEAMRRIRGRRIGLVPQGAMSALNPVQTVRWHVAESLIVHRGMADRDARDQAVSHLAAVGIDADRADAYPHEFSGGMRQRVVLALTLAAGPRLVIADEPTVGLDAAVQRTALMAMASAVRQVTAVEDGGTQEEARVHGGTRASPEGRRGRDGPGLVLVSHDLPAVLDTCTDVVVMYAGEVVETASAAALAADAATHPYAAGLIGARPGLTDGSWRGIPGSGPDLRTPTPGCAFAPRCPHRLDRCDVEAPLLQTAPGGGAAACHLLDLDDRPRPSASDYPVSVSPVDPTGRAARTGRDGADSPAAEVRGLVKTYATGRGTTVTALAGADLTIGRGEMVGILGASGSGKSTLTACLLRLVEPDSGDVEVDGIDVLRLRGRALRRLRGRIGLVQQDPYDALHPAMGVRDLVAEPLRIAGVRGSEADRQVAEALELLDLPTDRTFLDRRPTRLSGGQRQRVAIARAVVTRPVLLIADEPTSMLDVSVRAGVAARLRDIRDATQMAVAFVTHDLAEAAVVCDRLVVVHDGAVVEEGRPEALLAGGTHAATRALTGHDRPPTPAEPVSSARTPSARAPSAPRTT